jgi:outer membrane protein assembly factor BamB
MSSVARRRALGAAIVTSVVAGLSCGCEGLASIASPEVPLWVHHPGTALSVFARRKLGSEASREGEPYERGRPEIDPPHRRLFVGSSDHGLYALRAADLVTLWRFETGGAVQSEPLYDLGEDAVYFGSNDGALYKLRAADGQLLWRFASNAEISRRPVLHHGKLFVTNANDTLVALDPANGQLSWYRQRPPAGAMEISGYAGPAVLGDRAYAAFSDGVVMAYRTDDGREAWSAPVDLGAEAEQLRAGEELRYLDSDATPVTLAVGDTRLLFVASYEGGVFGLDALSGARIWANDAATGVTELTLWRGPIRPRPGAPRPGSGAPPAERRVLVAASGLTGLWAFDPTDGSELWRRDLPAGGITAVATCSGALLAGTTRYGVFLLHPLDGGVLDGLHSGGAFAATPAAHGRRAYLLSNEGVLFGLSVAPPG